MSWLVWATRLELPLDAPPEPLACAVALEGRPSEELAHIARWEGSDDPRQPRRPGRDDDLWAPRARLSVRIAPVHRLDKLVAVSLQ